MKIYFMRFAGLDVYPFMVIYNSTLFYVKHDVSKQFMRENKIFNWILFHLLLQTHQ